MEVGIVLFIIGVFSMLVIDLIGHNVTTEYHKHYSLLCFIENYGTLEMTISMPKYFFFKFPWYVLIIPNCFSVISYSLIIVTLLEFISAQAPQPMKGLVFGVFFAIKGIFSFHCTTILLIPFSLKATSHPSITITSVVGVVISS